MIAYIHGKLLEATDKSCIILTPGGVGYELFLTITAISTLPEAGADMVFYVHSVVREDAFDLYGFPCFDDREVFRTLISIDRLGPKKALAILSQFNPKELQDIVFREDVKTLSIVPGIGPKSARQILWSLKDKMETLKSAVVRSGSCPAEGDRSEFLDALSGLRNLGYADDEVREFLKNIFDEEPDLDAGGAIRVALKKISQSK
ncbi:Holliday junction branch migration protein RuvA [Maridesulfovibrio hydrothermalis]|uniref:Holliday junction branch migration complex subunit RuvA n=1 Tax=Maridesulfovibrio hydrothermalis AM13 = DSM 14728 TaxID=1121451 RepID=L0RIE9_9BACT|nr:Holliday junction branch migration protein RuvA [Maridesulfovibrio hydrothermalis]CCO25376.1 Holliday junction ATP-dependent DNA helicase RuvA [Maridesulfovibrio hydrothermalis AM13 = DSM 14728]